LNDNGFMVGPYWVGDKEIIDIKVSTSSGQTFTQSVPVHRSDSTVLVRGVDEIYMFVLGSVPVTLQKQENGLYALGTDSISSGFECSSLYHDDPLYSDSELGTLSDKIVTVYLEADKALYDNKGGVAPVVSYLTALFEAAKLVYAKENIKIAISEIFVWDTQDSYSTSSSTTALQQFKQIRPNANGNLKHLVALAGKNLGGVAWVNALCTGYGYAYSNIQSGFNPYPSYSWTLMVFVHEMGHNLGSPHTQACKWGPNSNQALDNCFTTEGGCAPGPAPINGGTIMSYCHITSNGINLNHGFGVEPGNLIRSRVSSASCLSTGICSNPLPIPGETGSNSISVNWNHTSNSYYIRIRSDQDWLELSTNQNSYVFKDLEPDRAYEIQLRADCASYSESIFIRTKPLSSCKTFASQGFETEIGFIQSGSDHLNWIRKTGSTPSSGTGPTSAYEGNFYVYVESSSPGYPNKTAELISECFTAKNAVLEFAYNLNGIDQGSLALELNNTEIWSISGNQGPEWKTAQIPIPDGTHVIKFKAKTGKGYRSDIALDHVRMSSSAPKPCPIVSLPNSDLEWIESVVLDQVPVISGKNRYFNHELNTKSPQNITITMKTPRNYCQDSFIGVYSYDNGSWVVNHEGPIKTSVNVSNTVGTEFIRIILSNNPVSSACTVPEYGEIEDYVFKL